MPKDQNSLLSLADAAALFNETANQLRRWSTRGYTCHGRTVILQTLSQGSRRYIRAEWLEQFKAEVNTLRGLPRSDGHSVADEAPCSCSDAVANLKATYAELKTVMDKAAQLLAQLNYWHGQLRGHDSQEQESMS